MVSKSENQFDKIGPESYQLKDQEPFRKLVFITMASSEDQSPGSVIEINQVTGFHLFGITPDTVTLKPRLGDVSQREEYRSRNEMMPIIGINRTDLEKCYPQLSPILKQFEARMLQFQRRF